MREYTTIVDEEEREQRFFLCPIGSAKPDHFIKCSDAKEAHSLKLSLGLGTQPDPSKMPHYYQQLPENYNDCPVYEVVKLEDIEDGWSDPGCCESGCNGCPWTLKNLGTV